MGYIDVAIRASREAGRYLMDNFGTVKDYEYKYKNSMVTEVDRKAETLITDIILSTYPDHSIYAEEFGQVDSGSDHRWIIDPLDGTTNFLHSYPFFSVSIALEVGGEVVCGVVYDPFKDELFAAERGGGATLNGRPLSPSGVESLTESLVVTGFTHEHEWMFRENLRHMYNFMERVQAFRRDGAASLDLCYVAAGRVDGFWEIGLHAWDVAAGVLIVCEAGGRVSDFSGGELDIYGDQILATNGIIHDEMVSVLALGRGGDASGPGRGPLRE